MPVSFTRVGCQNRQHARDGADAARVVVRSARDSERGNPVARTRRSFRYLWERVAAGEAFRDSRDHFSKVAAAVDLHVPTTHSWVLDAGCGDGLDAHVIASRYPHLRVVGIDLSDTLRTGAVAEGKGSKARFAQADVLLPPFRSGLFALVYSYGVLHHTVDPAAAFSALARLLAPGGEIVIYVYSDLRAQPLLRVAVAAVALVRNVTTRFPSPLLFRLCQIGSPLVYLIFVLPRLALRRIPFTRRWSERFPFNWVQRPMGAVGDLYDRFSAPLEWRQSADEVRSWFARSGLSDVRVTSIPNVRGWVAVGTRLSRPRSSADAASEA